MKIAILGTGAFGIALANLLNKKHNVLMWTKFDEEKEMLLKERKNQKLLPGVLIDNNIQITSDLDEAINEKDIVINALPFAAIESLTDSLQGKIKEDQIICSTTKGIDNEFLLVTTEIMEKKLNCRICALSGPSFAIDLVNGNNISLMLGIKEVDTAKKVVEIFKDTCVDITVTEDILGIQIAGAVKNAISIGAGILDAKKASPSTKAKYLTEGLIDMGKIIKALGGKEETVYTSAGVGDLMLTCTGSESRNFTFGKYIGKGLSKDEALEKMNNKTVEGYEIIESLHNLVKSGSIKSKIIVTLYNILYNNEDINKIKEI